MKLADQLVSLIMNHSLRAPEKDYTEMELNVTDDLLLSILRYNTKR